MALLDSELARCKAELGYPLVSNAQPYIGVTMIFEQVVKVYMTAGAKTTSSTAVSPNDPVTPLAITLADAAGFSAGDRIVVDVDDRQESVTVQSISGSAVTALFGGIHSGTYPVTVEGGESLVREKLRACRELSSALVDASDGLGALKRADDVEWYQSTTSSVYKSIRRDLMTARDELAAVLGVVNLWRARGGSSMVMY